MSGVIVTPRKSKLNHDRNNTRIFYVKWNFAEQQVLAQKLSADGFYTYIQMFNHDGIGWALPKNREQLALTLGVTAESVHEVLDKLACMFVIDSDRIYHKEILDARDKAAEISAKRTAAGKVGAAARWDKKGGGAS